MVYLRAVLSVPVALLPQQQQLHPNSSAWLYQQLSYVLADSSAPTDAVVNPLTASRNRTLSLAYSSTTIGGVATLELTEQILWATGTERALMSYRMWWFSTPDPNDPAGMLLAVSEPLILQVGHGHDGCLCLRHNSSV